MHHCSKGDPDIYGLPIKPFHSTMRPSDVRATKAQPLERLIDSRRMNSLLLLGASFVGFLAMLVCMIRRLPAFPAEQKQHIKFPKTVDDLKSLGIVISEYQDNYYWEILLFMSTTYIFLQSFMIPGSIFLSVLLGYLFPFPVALGLVALCSAVGASLCYLLIGFVGSKVLLFLIPEKIEYCRSMIHRYRNAMFLCICFLRISPLIPNWLINVSSPIIEVPLLHFFWGTFIGVVPLSVVFVKAGTVLQELTDLGVTSVTSVYTLITLSVLSMLPFIFRKQIKRWFAF